MQELLERQEAYIESYETLLRMGLDATEKYAMEEGAAGFRLLSQDAWAGEVRKRGRVLRHGASILADALQEAEELYKLLTSKAEGGVQ